MPSEPSSIKVRLRNSDAQRGKSGGYRVIYYLKTKAKIILVGTSKNANLIESRDGIPKVLDSPDSQ